MDINEFKVEVFLPEETVHWRPLVSSKKEG